MLTLAVFKLANCPRSIGPGTQTRGILSAGPFAKEREHSEGDPLNQVLLNIQFSGIQVLTTSM